MRETEALISVVIPAYNAAATLAAALDSVLQQSWRRLEAVVVDDGSHDRSGEIARAYAAADRRCRYLRQENTGLAGARNRGIEAARGELVAFLDADDLYAPGKLEKQMALRRQAPTDSAVLTGLRRFTESDGHRSFLTATAVPAWPEDDPLAGILLLAGNQMALFTTALLPRRCLLRAGKFDPRLRTAHDWDLGLRLALHCAFRAVPEPLYLYRKHAGSMSSTENLEETLRAHLAILQQAAGRSPIPRALLRRAERGRYLEHIRALLYYRRFDAAWRMLLAGCREKSLFLERQFPGLCFELVAAKMGLRD